ncbi:uncharacterized protein LACBIDRAFT_296562 [Laccaria bicolor S238N-H82]|uniref:Predicted protein n=1 Tax=Laccaria bicolor (strain S238N-H82 / ATCC MYA-4686) TaxID=486041 RepID=B0D943_LACBS|nr:uncharacterized protein LACBIDRAFT_296562 [Laccaria bicolor S238N-H82]EDR08944.1 predicted protein [Laccaria bicolor S238N-H82]|eukprot:XP_001880257.1 predicted protein [Laccaria bicolor S238N-H82]
MAIVPTVPDVRLSFGPMLIGVFLNMILYGILIVQVVYVFFMETLNTGCNMAMMYQPLIQNFGRPVATTLFPTLFAAGKASLRAERKSFNLALADEEPITIVAISTPIQLFFAYRIWLLSKNNWLPGVIAFFAVVSLGGGTWTTVLIVKVKVFARKPELHWPALLWFLSAVVSDVMITVVLVITLNKRKTGFTATDDVISKIIRTTVQTGMLTALVAIGDVIFFMTLPVRSANFTVIQKLKYILSRYSTLPCTRLIPVISQNFYCTDSLPRNFIWDLALTKLYANCLLSTLNARAKLNETSGKYSNQNNVQLSSGDRRFVSVNSYDHVFFERSLKARGIFIPRR